MCAISVHHVSDETIGICIFQMSFTHNFKTSATVKGNNWEKPQTNKTNQQNIQNKKPPKHKQTNEQTNKQKPEEKYHHNKIFFLLPGRAF